MVQGNNGLDSRGIEIFYELDVVINTLLVNRILSASERNDS